MKKVTIAVLAAALVGCNVPNDVMQRLMRQENVVNWVDGRYSFFGCAKDDSFHEAFVGIKNGVPVKGYVCGGITKGYTIRYE